MSPYAFAFDPSSGQIYVHAVGRQPGEHDYSFHIHDITADGQRSQLFAPDIYANIEHLAITRNGYLLGGGSTLTVRRLIALHNWTVAPELQPYARSRRVQLFGGTLSPATLCGRNLCQYFDKGGLQVRGH